MYTYIYIYIYIYIYKYTPLGLRAECTHGSARGAPRRGGEAVDCGVVAVEGKILESGRPSVVRDGSGGRIPDGCRPDDSES